MLPQTHTLHLPTVIAGQAGLPLRIDCAGRTARDAVEDACRQVPALVSYLSPALEGTEWGGCLFVDGRTVHAPDEHVLAPGAQLRVILPAAGG